ncbi:MAG: isoprenylcysteine carboxylmethyltransferase family protein [Planctomycetaceae bacterium]|nr:isoprenylcysteine carboxylmethyltransferase family protein [Planctomycetaceae bacterium]
MLICLWWMGLSFSPDFFQAFQFAGIPPVAFWSFFAPDLLLIAGLSLVRAYTPIVTLEYVILGAFGYATFYCCNATFLTHSGLLSSGLMLLGLAFNGFLCFPQFFFRASRSSSFTMNAVKTGVQVLCIWFLALVLIPYVLLDAFDQLAFPERGLNMVVALILFGLFSLLGLTSSYFMVRDGAGTPLPLDQTNHLVQSGPYRYVRNPMAIAGIGQGLAIALLFHSLPIVIYCLLGAIIWHFVVRPIEERDLAARYGDPYQNYRKQVMCWIPTFRRVENSQEN